MTCSNPRLPAYRSSLAGTLLAAREAVMAPIRPELRSADVTEQQWRVLRVLDDHESLDAAALAAAALLHAPSLTRILKELNERGLITRGPDPGDARRSIVAITAAGRRLIGETAAHTLAVLEGYAEAFGRERLEALRQEIAAFTASIARFAPKG